MLPIVALCQRFVLFTGSSVHFFFFSFEEKMFHFPNPLSYNSRATETKLTEIRNKKAFEVASSPVASRWFFYLQNKEKDEMSNLFNFIGGKNCFDATLHLWITEIIHNTIYTFWAFHYLSYLNRIENCGFVKKVQTVNKPKKSMKDK